MKRLAGLLAVLILAACSAGGEDAAFRKAIREASAEAKDAFEDFWARYEAPAENEYDFRIKIDIPGEALSADEGGGLWVEDVVRSEAGFTARAAAVAGTVSEGDRVSFVEADIRDWSFVRGEELIGHYTTRVMLPRLPPDQADALKSMFGENPD